MRGRVGGERDPALPPALDVAPREVREPPSAVGDVPAVEPPGVVGDDEARGGESVRLEHGERVLAKSAVGVVERDHHLARRPRRGHLRASHDLGQSDGPISVARQPLHLTREAPRREAGHAQLAAALDLVVAENERLAHAPPHSSGSRLSSETCPGAPTSDRTPRPRLDRRSCHPRC